VKLGIPQFPLAFSVMLFEQIHYCKAASKVRFLAVSQEVQVLVFPEQVRHFDKHC
jgi:hypothetical protein